MTTATARSLPRPSASTARSASWLAPVLVYLAVRAVGLLVLAMMAASHGLALESVLAKWDGQWLLAIAEHGYTNTPANLTDAQGVHSSSTGYAFFPGFPMLVGLFGRIPGLGFFGASMLVNAILGAVAAVGVARLGARCASLTSRGEPERTGLILVALFASAPMAVVLNLAYTEALFCALAAWALVWVLNGQWILAGFAALAIGLVRPTGLAVIVVVMLAALIARRDGPRAWAAVVLAPLGYLGYLGFVAVKTGSLTGWFAIQTQGWETSIDFGAAAWEFVTHSLTEETTFAPIATTTVMLATLGLLAWSFVARLPWPVLTYAALVTASIIFSSGLMMSRARLLLPAFVVLIPLAMLLSRQRSDTTLAVLTPIVLASAWFGAYMLTVFQYAI